MTAGMDFLILDLVNSANGVTIEEIFQHLTEWGALIEEDCSEVFQDLLQKAGDKERDVLAAALRQIKQKIARDIDRALSQTRISEMLEQGYLTIKGGNYLPTTKGKGYLRILIERLTAETTQ